MSEAMTDREAFDGWWKSYWKNRTDTDQYTIARSIARDAWWAGGDMEATRRAGKIRSTPVPDVTFDNPVTVQGETR